MQQREGRASLIGVSVKRLAPSFGRFMSGYLRTGFAIVDTANLGAGAGYALETVALTTAVGRAALFEIHITFRGSIDAALAGYPGKVIAVWHLGVISVLLASRPWQHRPLCRLGYRRSH